MTHTMNVIIVILTEQEFATLSSEEQNILLWSGLLHDIEKTGPPIHEGKDHIHPFKGAITVLEFAKREGLIKLDSSDLQNDFDKLKQLISESTQPVH